MGYNKIIFLMVVAISALVSAVLVLTIFPDKNKGKNPSSAAPVLSVTADASFGNFIAKQDRKAISEWFQALSIQAINESVNALSLNEKNKLATAVLKVKGNSTQAQKDDAYEILFDAVKSILANHSLGFYAEIFSYTDINIEGSGLFGNCGNVYLTQASLTPKIVWLGSETSCFMRRSIHSIAETTVRREP